MGRQLPFEESTDSGSATVEGVVRRVVYASAEDAWTVIRLNLAGGRQVITAVGNLLGVQPGEELRLTGTWVSDRKYGKQFRVASCLTLQPSTLEGLRRYLGSGLIPGIGKVMADRLVAAFGLEALEIIANNPDRLSEVDGIGPVRAERIRRAWLDQEGLREAVIALQSLGITTHQALKIHKRFGEAALAEVKRNPFRLATEIFGIGFKGADQIAARLGLPPDSPERAAAGISYVLTQAADRGHLYLPHSKVFDQATTLLGIDREIIIQTLDKLEEGQDVIAEELPGIPERAIYRPDLFAAEQGTAERLHGLLTTSPPPLELAIDRALGWYESREQLELAPEQRQAIREALTAKLLIITGGPGTGKTTLIRAVVEILSRKGRRVLLAAPTGRAAKRLSETAGAEAKTIHRLLEFDPRAMAFLRHRQRPVEADTLIVDEASMLDCPLSRQLVDAIPDPARLVLVGDVDQLPSVGPGRVLGDLIESRQVPVARLEQVFRQLSTSRIVVNAHRIRRGALPELVTEDSDSDFFFIRRADPEGIVSTVKQLVSQRIPKRFGLDPRFDIQVLSPMRRGLLGSENLNRELQELLNPSGRQVAESKGRLRIGDRVMQVRNNYDLEVFNGDIGRIAAAGKEGVQVVFEGRIITYEALELDELVPAYACSVHKSQGSEYPCVIMPVHTQHFRMLQRNLLYTAVTRGQRLVVLVGSQRAVAVAVNNARPQHRYTRLAERLRELA